MNKFIFGFLGALLLVAQSAAQTREVPGISDYAYLWPIALDSDNAFHAVELPLEVYESAADGRLRDLGVFNGGDEPVPRSIRAAAPVAVETERRLALRAIPLWENQAKKPEEIRLLLQADLAQATLEVAPATSNDSSPAEKKLSAYVIDTRNLDAELNSLELVWPEPDSGFIASLQVQASNDLETWKTLGEGSIADLKQDGARIKQNRINILPAENDYLRIIWRKLPSDWRLRQITGIVRHEEQRSERQSTVLQAVDDSPPEQAKTFDLGGSPPIDQINLILPADNTVLRATIHGRQDRQQKWRRVHSGIFYKLSQGSETLATPAVSIRPRRYRHWRVNIESGRKNTELALELGWRTEKLVFVAQGSKPFKLAAGRAADAFNGFPLEKEYGDLEIINLANDDGTVGGGRLAQRQVSGGPELLSATRPLDWRQWILWVGLLAGVAVVGLLASRLIRQMQAS